MIKTPASLNYVEGQVEVSNDTIIGVLPKYWFRHKNNNVLIIEPQTASWLAIPLQYFSLLQNIESSQTFAQILQNNNDLPPETIKLLLKAFYENQLISINGTFRYKPETLWQFKEIPYFITIHLTERCNFACTYCYGSYTTKGEPANLKTLKHIIKRLFNEIPLKELALEFHGGEPLLEFDLLIQAAEYAQELAKSTGKRVLLMCQSNGSLLTTEKIQLLQKYNLQVGVSLDGPPSMHNRHRVNYTGKGTFQQVWDGIECLKNAKQHVGPLCVISKPNEYKEAFQFFVENGITDISIRRAFSAGRAKNSILFDESLDEEFAKGFLESIDLWQEYNKNHGAGAARLREAEYILINIISKSRLHMCHRTPCGAGNAHIAFDVRGNFYACDEFVGREQFKIGNIYDDVPIAKTISTSPVCKALQERNVEAIPKCKECPFKYFCTEGCASRVHSKFGTIMRESHFCRFQEVVIEELMWKIALDPKLIELTIGPYLPKDLSLNRYSLLLP